MLPEELSNGLCSLKENEDRFAITLLIEVNSKYSIKNYKIVESIINVKKRYSYEDVIDFISKKENIQKKIVYNFCLQLIK